jgi:hypothetical protein
MQRYPSVRDVLPTIVYSADSFRTNTTQTEIGPNVTYNKFSFGSLDAGLFSCLANDDVFTEAKRISQNCLRLS